MTESAAEEYVYNRFVRVNIWKTQNLEKDTYWV